MITVVIVLFGIAALFMCPMLIGAVLAFLFYGTILGVLYLIVPTTWFWGSIAVFALFWLYGHVATRVAAMRQRNQRHRESMADLQRQWETGQLSPGLADLLTKLAAIQRVKQRQR
jgi:uncharacterized membrane protein YdjX (TVP38/TMEM64 family)